MRKNLPVVMMLLLSITLYGCSTNHDSDKPQTEQMEIARENQPVKETQSVMEKEHMEAENSRETEDQPIAKRTTPTKEEVLAMREQVLEGMSKEEAERLTENIKVANLRMESAYLNDNIFEELEDTKSLYWNYFDQKGDIQVGWAYEGDYHEIISIMEQENLSIDEFYSAYGTPVTVYNRFDAKNFIDLIAEMKATVQNEKLQEDLQRMMDETSLAAKTHEMQHAYLVYQLLHDMDYYLLRYGVEDVGKYVKDLSTVSKYYGVLSVYSSNSCYYS